MLVSGNTVSIAISAVNYSSGHHAEEKRAAIQSTFPILALAMFSSVLGLGIVSPLLPLYGQSMGASGFWLGAIVAAYGATSTLSTPFFGRLSDRRGRKQLLCVGLLCYSVISLAYIWADNVFSLVLVRLLQGAASGMTVPIAMAYIGDVSPVREEGKWMGYAQAAFFSGFGLGPLLGGGLTEHFSMSVTFYFMGGLNLIAFLIAIILLPEVKSRHWRGDTAPFLSFREIARSRTVKGVFCFRVAEAMGRGTFITFLAIFAVTYLGLGLTLVGTLLAVNATLMALLGSVGGHLADRFNRRGLVISSGLLFLLSQALIPLASNFWQLFTLCISLACATALSAPAISALTVEEGRKFGMGSSMAILNMAMSIGIALGPVISGKIVDFAGINASFYFATIMSAVGTGLFARLTSRRQGT